MNKKTAVFRKVFTLLSVIEKKSKLAWTCWSLVVAMTVSAILLILWYPISKPENSIRSLLFAGTITLALSITAIYHLIAQFKKSKNDINRSICIFILAALLCMLSTRRDFEIERIMWEFEGVITKKYRSHNHGALSIEVKGNGLTQYESIEESFWNSVHEGDHIKKENFSLYAYLNGDKHIFVCNYLLQKHRGRLLKE